MRLQRNYVCAVWLREWSRGVSHPPAHWKPISTWSRSSQTSRTFPFFFLRHAGLPLLLFSLFSCLLLSQSLLFSPHHVFGGSTASLSRMAHMTTGTDHRGFISAPGRSGFIHPSPAQRNTALLSPVLGCQPLIIEFPIDPLPSARL